MCKHSNDILEATKPLQSFLNIVATYGTAAPGEIKTAREAVAKLEGIAEAIDIEAEKAGATFRFQEEKMKLAKQILSM